MSERQRTSEVRPDDPAANADCSACRSYAACRHHFGLRAGDTQPAFNHTREDGPFDPCPACLPLMTQKDLVALVEDNARDMADMRNTIDQLRRERALSSAGVLPLDEPRTASGRSAPQREESNLASPAKAESSTDDKGCDECMGFRILPNVPPVCACGAPSTRENGNCADAMTKHPDGVPCPACRSPIGLSDTTVAAMLGDSDNANVAERVDAAVERSARVIMAKGSSDRPSADPVVSKYLAMRKLLAEAGDALQKGRPLSPGGAWIRAHEGLLKRIDAALDGEPAATDRCPACGVLGAHAEGSTCSSLSATPRTSDEGEWKAVYDRGVADGHRLAVAACVKVCEDRHDHFKRMAISSAATKTDPYFAHEAGECVEAIKRDAPFMRAATSDSVSVAEGPKR